LGRDLPIPLAPELQLGERDTRRMLGTIIRVEDETAGPKGFLGRRRESTIGTRTSFTSSYATSTISSYLHTTGGASRHGRSLI
jgi:hypothetical protein